MKHQRIGHPAGQRAAPIAVRAHALASRLAQAARIALLLALLLLPMLGRLHALLHADALALGHSGTVLLTAAPGAHGACTACAASANHGAQRAGNAFAQGLVAEHDLADCLLFDQLALGAAICAAAPLLPQRQPRPGPPLARAMRSGALHVALFQARAPPAA